MSVSATMRATAIALLLAMPALANQATGTKPANDPGEWVLPDDYPPEALRQNQKGITSFMLHVDREGVVTHCDVTGSSGSALLDETSCALLTKRARFTPARDKRGKALESTYSSGVRWQIPEDREPPPMQLACLQTNAGNIHVTGDPFCR